MPKAPRARSALIVTVAATICGAAISVAEAQQPDFTGVWETYRGAPQGRASGFGGARAGSPADRRGTAPRRGVWRARRARRGSTAPPSAPVTAFRA